MKTRLAIVTTFLFVFGFALVSSASTFDFSYTWASGGQLIGTFEGMVDPTDSNHIIATTSGLTSAWYNTEAVAGLEYDDFGSGPINHWYVDGLNLGVATSLVQEQQIDIWGRDTGGDMLVTMDNWVTAESELMVASRWSLVQAAPVPIPGAIWLLGTGLLGLLGFRKKRNA